MAEYTPNYSLYKPNRNDSEAVDTTLSSNFTAIDSELKKNADEVAVVKSELETKTTTIQGDLDNKTMGLQEQVNTLVVNGDSSPAIAQALSGTPFETLKEKLDDTDNNLAQIALNVKAYGAKGDGVTDDTAAFQACADALNAIGGGGFIVPFTSSGYSIKGTVIMPSNVVLRGNNSLIVANTSDNAQTPFKWENKTDVTVENLRINGVKELKDNQVSIAGGSCGLHFHGDCKRIRIKNCHIFNTLEHGIRLGGYVSSNPDTVHRVVDVVIEGCTFENNGNPDWTAGPRGTCIMTFYGTRKLKVTNNYFKDCAQTFIYIDSGYATRETLENNYPGLSVLNGDYMGEDNEVTGNTFEVTVDHGKFTSDVTGNGIAVHGQKRCTVANNSFYFPVGKYKGVYVSVGQEHSPTQDVLIFDNKIVSNYQPVTVFQSEKVSIKNNIIRKTSENIEAAVLLWYADSPTGWASENKLKLKQIEVTGNTIHSPQYQGIYVKNGGTLAADITNILIRQNTIYVTDSVNAFSSCIYDDGACSGLYIFDNQMYGGYHGVYIGSTAEKTYIKRNFVNGSQRGIVGNAPVILEQNETVDCPTYGIRLVHADSVALFNTGAVSLSTEIKSYVHMNGANLRLGNGTAESWKRPLQFLGVYGWTQPEIYARKTEIQQVKRMELLFKLNIPKKG